MTYPIGTHLKVSRASGLYTHHGIYVGNGEVIHYAGFYEIFKYEPIGQVFWRSFKEKLRISMSLAIMVITLIHLKKSCVVPKVVCTKINTAYYAITVNICVLVHSYRQRLHRTRTQRLNHSSKKPKNKPLPQELKQINKAINRHRIKIEHINNRLKIFKTLSLPYRNHQNTLTAYLIAGIVNRML